MKLIVDNGQIIGTTTPDDPNGYVLVDAPEDFSGDLQSLVYDAETNTARVSLDALRARRITSLNAIASQQISALGWRIERAKEREVLGLPGETVNAVLLEREAMRRASSRCEAEINAAQDTDAVNAVTFAVTATDRATPERISRLAFMSRFTDAEMAAIVEASQRNAALGAAVLKWQAADGIVLTDPATTMGVQALEIMGLIAAGRAADILAVGSAP